MRVNLLRNQFVMFLEFACDWWSQTPKNRLTVGDVWKPDKFEDFVSKNPQYLGKIVVFSDKNRDGVFGDMPEDLLTFTDGQLREVEEIRKENQATASEIFVGVNAENVK